LSYGPPLSISYTFTARVWRGLPFDLAQGRLSPAKAGGRTQSPITIVTLTLGSVSAHGSVGV